MHPRLLVRRLGNVWKQMSPSWLPKGAFQLPKEQKHLLVALEEVVLLDGVRDQFCFSSLVKVDHSWPKKHKAQDFPGSFLQVPFEHSILMF